MTVEEMYRCAWGLAPKSPYIEDIVQDAVISAWLTAKKKWRNGSYLKQHIRFRLANAYERYSSWGYEELEEWHHPYVDSVVLSLPLKGKKREVTEALIQNNFELAEAARYLGLSYLQAWRIWCAARNDLREEA